MIDRRWMTPDTLAVFYRTPGAPTVGRLPDGREFDYWTLLRDQPGKAEFLGAFAVGEATFYRRSPLASAEEAR